MSTPLPQRLFVTGTDTDVGKTVVSAIIMAGRGGYYFKPVQTGIHEGPDSDFLNKVTPNVLPEAYRLTEPLSPHEAAQRDGVVIDMESIKLPSIPDDAPLVVEGAGGVMVPLNDNATMLDLMKTLGLPVLLVARSGLGTINHTLLSLHALRSAGVPVAGVVMNGERNAANKTAIEQFGKVQVLAQIEPLTDFSTQRLKQAYAAFSAG